MSYIISFLSFWLTVSDVSEAHVNSYTKNIIIEESGSMTVSVAYDIQINNRKGDWLSEVGIYYRKGNRIKSLEAEILDSQGNLVKKLKNKDIRDRHSISNSALYEDDYIREFQLIHHQYPYRLRYSYTQEYDSYLTLCRWVPYVDFDIPTLNATLTLTKPEDYKINIYSSDSTIELTQKNQVFYQWEAKNCAAIREEQMGPSAYEQSPKVIITPDQFSYGRPGSFVSWQSYGDWVLDLNENCMDFSATQKEEIRKSVAHLKSDKDKVKMLYNKMQDEIRYILVDIDFGGFQSYPASYVANNKYGDCKALTTYMQASLDAIGIQAFPVLVYADEYIPVLEDFPNNCFNHIFLCVPLEQDSIWLENTSKTDPFDQTSTFTQNRKGLFLKKGESILVNLPKIGLEENLSTRKMEITVQEDKFQIDFTGRYKGSNFERYNSISRNWSYDDTEEYLRKNFPISNVELMEWEILEHDRNEPELTLQANAIAYGKIKKYGPNRALFLPSTSPLIDLESSFSRQTELRIRVPQNLSDTIIYHLDTEKYNHIILPDSIDIESKVGHYSLHFHNHPQGAVAIRNFQYTTGNYPPGEAYMEFYEFQKEIRKSESQTSIKLKL
ncbi:DUF3857 and transglutaminase domain-containing protein [Reichenbachiella ulvae]|uniref:DUF3857 and transglutaminase domain-containing protein n=1 Tax=Reichenbachiella ulvae TaxID=2980104 RepID=A0ABT3CVR6_9BACT|nr:DUF3857 and transglutaminase domain-containing protein [Reichenbachiella ulvae]MCV9387791.1 DUF3857 and transglutaminase domain-containing protein [Reichenbachiella ulvae]